MNVRVFQWPCGTLATSRSPRGERPEWRTILVVTDVSSIKTSRRLRNDDCSAFNSARAAATSGRSCSAACSVFFERDAVPLVKSPNRGSADLQSFSRSEPDADLIRCQIGVKGPEMEQPLPIWVERGATVSGAGLRCDATGCMPAIHPADSGRGRKIKQARGFPAALATLDQSHHTISQICRIALGDDRPRPQWLRRLNLICCR